MAEKEAKNCPEVRRRRANEAPLSSLRAESKVTYFTGAGRKGFFWVCDKSCGYVARTR
jgi:hypothetical protein